MSRDQHHRASGLCAMGWHRPDPVAHWNDGYYFTRCLRCGEDLVRTAYSGWQVPKGYKVVWQGKPPPGKPSADLVPADQEPAAAPAASGAIATRERLRHLNAETLADAPPGLTRVASDELGAPPATADAASVPDHSSSQAAQPTGSAAPEPAGDMSAGDLNGSATKPKAELPVMALIREIKGGGEGVPAERSEPESGASGGDQPSAGQDANEEAAPQAERQPQVGEPTPQLEPAVAAQPEPRSEADAAPDSETEVFPTAAAAAQAEPELQADMSEPAPEAEQEQAQRPHFGPGDELGSPEEQGELPGISFSATAPAQPAPERREADAPEAEQHGQEQGELREAPENEQQGDLLGAFRQADAPEDQQQEGAQSSALDGQAAAQQPTEAVEAAPAQSETIPDIDGTQADESAPSTSSLFDDFMEEDPNTDAWTDLASNPLPEPPRAPAAQPEPTPQLEPAPAAASAADPATPDVEHVLREEPEESGSSDRSFDTAAEIQQEKTEIQQEKAVSSPAPAPSEQPLRLNDITVVPKVSSIAHGSESQVEDGSAQDVVEVYRGLKIAPGNAEQVRHADFMEETPPTAESAGGAKQPRWWVAGPVAGSLAVLVLVAFFSGGREPAIGSGASRSAITAPAAEEAAPLTSGEADSQSPLAQAAVDQPIAPAAEPAQQRETAFVAASFLQCRSAPVRQAPAVRKLARGDSVEVLTRIPEWASVSHRGRQCWVADRFISPVEPL